MADLFLTFSLAVLVLGLIPGPNVLAIVATSLRYGLSSGLLVVMGTTLGLGVQLIVVVLGLSALIEVFAGVLSVLRLFGVGYLFYLAVRAWHSSSKKAGEGQSGLQDSVRDHQPAVSSVMMGAVTALFNPKTFLFNAALLPQFVASDAFVSVPVQLMGLAVVYLVVLGLIDCGWVLFAQGAAKFLPRGAGFGGYIYAVCLGGCALLLAVSRR